jgi:hypothetical protein
MILNMLFCVVQNKKEMILEHSHSLKIFQRLQLTKSNENSYEIIREKILKVC